MPNLRGITVSLQSQYDALTISEYPLGAQIGPSSSLSLADHDWDDFSPDSNIPPPPPPSDSSSHITEVQIPIYPASQFWISYTCPPPLPGDRSFRFWYFKLVVAGECLVSWGVGERDQWRGKTMFALCDGGEPDFEGRRIVERRGFFFPPSARVAAGEGPGFEVRVFRSVARRRERALNEVGEGYVHVDGGFKTASLGRVRKGEPQRRYTYVLLDAVDEPYAAFKYHFSHTTPTTSLPGSPRSSGTGHQVEGAPTATA